MTARFASVSAEAVVAGLKAARVDFVASLPQTDMADILRLLDREPGITHVHLSREEEGFGICAGAYLGGKNPAILMQNTGLLAAGNALCSLNFPNGFPVLMVVSYSGYFGERNPWVTGPAQGTEPMLTALGVPYWLLREEAEAVSVLVAAHQLMHASKRPVAVLLPPRL